jgi:hypothetical protein
LAEACDMPTELPPPRVDPRDRSNLAAIIVVIVLVAGCLWLFHALGAANASLNCVAAGWRDCDHSAH